MALSFFRLFPSGVATADFPRPVVPSHSHSHSHTVYLPIIIGILLQDESRFLTRFLCVLHERTFIDRLRKTFAGTKSVLVIG